MKGLLINRRIFFFIRAWLWRTRMKGLWKSEYSKLKLVVHFRSWSRSALNISILKELQSRYNFIFVLSFINWLFNAVPMKLWWSHIPTSKTFEFLKSFFLLFVKIRSTQFGLADWKHVGFLIKYSMSNVLMSQSMKKISKYLLLRCINYQIVYLQKSWKRFLKLKLNF